MRVCIIIGILILSHTSWSKSTVLNQMHLYLPAKMRVSRAPASIEAYERMQQDIKQHGYRIGAAMCFRYTGHQFTFDPFTFEGERIYPDTFVKENARVLHQSLVGPFTRSKNHWLDQEKISLVHWRSHVGSHFAQELVQSPEFARAMASCFEKLADDPERMEAEVKRIINQFIRDDIAYSAIPGIALTMVTGAAIFKVAKVVKSLKLGKRLGRFIKRGRKLPVKASKSVSKGAAAKGVSKTATKSGNRTLRVLKQTLYVVPMVYVGNEAVKANFDFDVRSLLIGQAHASPSKDPPFPPAEDYERLLEWIPIWDENNRKIAEIMESSEEYSEKAFRSLSYSLGLREIIHLNIFSPNKETLKSLYDIMKETNMEFESQIISAALDDLEIWERDK